MCQKRVFWKCLFLKVFDLLHYRLDVFTRNLSSPLVGYQSLKSLVIAQILRQPMRLHKGIYASSWQHQFSFLVMSHDSVGGCVCPLVGQFMGWSIGPSFHNGFVSAGRDEPANNYIRQQDSIASTPTSSTLIAGCIH